MKRKFKTVYKDLETGIVHYAKHKADARYERGARIRVYNQDCRTMRMTPVCEWIPGSHDYYTFPFGVKTRHVYRSSLFGIGWSM